MHEFGQLLFIFNLNFNPWFIVRYRYLKTISADDGLEQVTGFYFPGEFVELDVIISAILLI